MLTNTCIYPVRLNDGSSFCSSVLLHSKNRWLCMFVRIWSFVAWAFLHSSDSLVCTIRLLKHDLFKKLISSVSQGWTLYEIVRYAPQHNWSAYEEALKTNPVLAKMVISGVVYSLGDWIAQVSCWFYSTMTNRICCIKPFRHSSICSCSMDMDMQCCQGKPLFEFDRTRMFRSGLVGFTLHGSLSHYYYQFCEVIMLARFLSRLIDWMISWFFFS